MAGMVVQTAARKLGKTEANWVAAVDEGTGITISSILFERRIPVTDLEAALRDVLALHPRLRSTIEQAHNEFFFQTPETVSVSLSEIVWSAQGEEEGDEDNRAQQLWHGITEDELNIPYQKCPVPVFEPKLYLLPESQSLLVLRLHAAAADMASTPIIIKQVVSSLYKRSGTEKESAEGVEDNLEKLKLSEPQEVLLPCIEDAIPSGQAKKPFWAHGVDVVGYGLVSRRHAYLPFDNPEGLRQSKLLRAGLTAEATDLLLKVFFFQISSISPLSVEMHFHADHVSHVMSTTFRRGKLLQAYSRNGLVWKNA